MGTHTALYEQDLYAWTQEQAARLREGAFQELDLEHLIEEIEDVGYSQQDALASHLLILLTHLLTLALAAVHRPHDFTRVARGWRVICRTQRLLIAKRLRRNPSLRRTVPDEVADAYEIAHVEAAAALEIEEDTVSPQCPWTPDEVLKADFWPEGEFGL